MRAGRSSAHHCRALVLNKGCRGIVRSWRMRPCGAVDLERVSDSRQGESTAKAAQRG